MRLLLVEDTARLRELLVTAVHGADWRIDDVGTLDEAEAAIATTQYDLMLIDLGLPDGDGRNLIRLVRSSGNKTPILIITARGAVDERISGLDAGADDYLVKPFNHGELLARCRALMRRAPTLIQPTLKVGHLNFDIAAGSLTCQAQDVGVTPRERAVLHLLMRDVGQVVAKRKLEHALSEFGDELSANAIELAVSRLRKNLEILSSGVTIETIRGLGYMLRETPV